MACSVNGYCTTVRHVGGERLWAARDLPPIPRGIEVDMQIHWHDDDSVVDLLCGNLGAIVDFVGEVPDGGKVEGKGILQTLDLGQDGIATCRIESVGPVNFTVSHCPPKPKPTQPKLPQSPLPQPPPKKPRRVFK